MKRWKRWMLMTLLPSLGVAAGLALSYERTASTASALIGAWHEAFGGASGAVLEVPIAAHSEGHIAHSEAVEKEEPEALPPKKKPAAKKPKAKKPAAKTAVPAKLAEKPAPAVQGTSTAHAPYLAADSCDVSRAEIPRGGVMMNEIAWAGSGGDVRAQWMEFKNVSQRTAVDLSGWKVLDRDGLPIVSFKAATSLGPGKMIVVARKVSEGEETFFFEEKQPAANVFSGMLSRYGGWLKLFSDDCILVDELVAPDGWPGGDIVTGATLERKANRGWQTSAAPGGTPQKENSAGFAPSRPVLVEDRAESGAPEAEEPEEGEQEADLPTNTPVIAAVRTTGGTGMTDHDAVKLYNPNDAPYLIGGWKLRKRTKTGTESSVKTFAEGSVIPARGYFVWANTKFTDAAANATSTAALSSDNSIALFNKEDAVIDAVAWGEGHVSPFVEGMPHPANPGAGEWLSRKAEGNDLKDSGDNKEDFEM